MARLTTSSQTHPSLSLRQRRILIVEDEYFISEEMVRDFEAEGAQVVGPFPSVEDGLEVVARNEPIDGAVLDINLRGEMVFPLADALRTRGVRFVFSTGYERWSIPTTYQGVTLCEKPVDSAKLARALVRP